MFKLFLFCCNLYWGSLCWDSYYLIFFSHSFPFHLPISIIVSVMPWSTVSSIARCTWSSARFTVRITCSPVLVSKSYMQFLGKLFAVYVEYSQWQSTSLFNSSYSPYISISRGNTDRQRSEWWSSYLQIVVYPEEASHTCLCFFERDYLRKVIML